MRPDLTRKRLLQAGWDALAWCVAVPVAALLRYDVEPPDGVLATALWVGVACALIQIIVGAAFHIYQGRYVVGSFDEVLGLTVIVAAIGSTGTAVLLLTPPTQFPRTTVIIASGIALTLMLGGRFLLRKARNQEALGRSGTRTLIYGAGDAGSQIATLMLSDTSGQFQPIGFIDDDPRKQHLRRGGLRVLGTAHNLEELIEQRHVETLLVAIAGITSDRLLELDRRCKPFGVAVQIIPTASEIVGGAVKLGDISEVTEEDLMGRRPIHTDEQQITAFISGKRVLVTGAGGSIGSELARQLSRYRPATLHLLDRDESALHSVQLSLDGSGTLESESLLLADIRDAERVGEIFSDLQPEIVFHAAALKHLPLLERFPQEAWKTNVLGTRNVMAAALDVGTKVFVNISTDKAADPTSVLGFSKLITERLAAGASEDEDATFVSVRFGNVLGSRGSVIETFRYQIAKGGPVTVTDENVTRYFMTISEAVHLVLQAAVIGRNGETLILDMGRPVRIIDVARHMIQRSGRDIPITFTGLRAGEKLDEVLIASDEASVKPLHPLVSHARVAPLNLSIEDGEDEADAIEIRERLRRLASGTREPSDRSA